MMPADKRSPIERAIPYFNNDLPGNLAADQPDTFQEMMT